MSCTLALLNRRMLVRHAMAYVGILRMEAICWRYGESRRTAIFQNKPEVSYATCPRVRDLLVTRIPYLSPWTIVSWWLSGDPRSTHIAPGASLLRYLSQEWKVINHLSKAHESLFYIGVINDNKFMKVRRLSRVNSRSSGSRTGTAATLQDEPIPEEQF